MIFTIIGCGSIGKRHIRTLLSMGHEVIAYNRGSERRNYVSREYGIQTFDSLDDIFERDADVAIICSPNSMHLKHALMAANKNLYLFIEKPLSHSEKGVKQLLEEVSQRKLITHVGSNMRFHFGPARIKHELEKGTLGRCLWASVWGGMYLPDWHPDEDYRLMYSARKALGGGVVLDFIHEIDMILWLFGKPDLVVGMTGRSGWLEIDTEDIADAILRYSNNFQVNLHVDYLQKPDQRGIKIIGTDGWIEWDHDDERVEVYHCKTRQSDVHLYPKKYNKQEMYTNQMKYFIGCVTCGSRSMSDIQSGLQALRLAVKIKKSYVRQTFIKW